MHRKFARIHRQCNEVSGCTLSLICFHSRTLHSLVGVKLSYIAMVNDTVHRETQKRYLSRLTSLRPMSHLRFYRAILSCESYSASKIASVTWRVARVRSRPQLCFCAVFHATSRQSRALVRQNRAIKSQVWHRS